MNDFYVLSDGELTKRISLRLKELRLKQNISRQDLSDSSGVSVSSIVRMEEGEIKSFDSFLRILRTLGKLDILMPLVKEEELSPSEYYKLVHSSGSAAAQRKRASKRRVAKGNIQEDVKW